MAHGRLPIGLAMAAGAALGTALACQGPLGEAPPSSEKPVLRPLALRGDVRPLPEALRRAAQARRETATVPVCPAPIVLYVNFSGGSLVGGNNCSDATSNPPCTFIVPSGQTAQIPAFSGGSTARSQIVQLTTTYFAPFNVQIVTSRPSSGNYEMSMVGGSPQDADPSGQLNGAAGVAPLDCGNGNPTDISFAFSEVTNNNVHDVAVTIAQESAHGFGLGHVALDTDIMYPALSGSEDSFHNQNMMIFDLGGGSSDCTGTGMQNDHTLLQQNVGLACSGGTGGGGTGGTGGGAGSSGDTTPPNVTITQPSAGSSVPAAFQVLVSASDNSGTVSRVDLLVDGSQVQEATSQPFTFGITSGLVAPGAHTLTATAYDPSGNNATSAPVAITVLGDGSGGAGGGTGGTGGTAGSGAGAGGTGGDGSLGSPCSGNDQCQSNQCVTNPQTGDQFCTEPCTDGCPDGFQCSQSICIPGGGSAAAGDQVSGSACAAVPGGRGASGSPLLLLACLGIFLPALRRRR